VACIYDRGPEILRRKPQALTKSKVKNLLGEGASAQDLEQAQKLFTCAHGVTLNWIEARTGLGLD
jgi:hypothetical protein